MRRTVVIVVVAVVIGLFAAVASVAYLRGARADIAAQNEPVKIFVAQKDLPQGTSAEELLSKKMIALVSVPRRFVPRDAISSERTIENQVLAASISKGEQLTSERFTYSADAGLSYSVPEGLVAISLKVDEVSGVAGLLKPGDNVMVFASYKVEGQKLSDKFLTQTLIPKARVLAVGGTVSDTGTEEAKSGGVLTGGGASKAEYSSVTLAVPPAQAGRVAFANSSGLVHLALLSQSGTGDLEQVSPLLGLFREPSMKSIHPVAE